MVALVTSLLLSAPPAPMYAAQRGEPKRDISKNEYGFAPGVPRAPRIGDVAPDFELDRAGGPKWALSKAVKEHAFVVVVFYRGYW